MSTTIMKAEVALVQVGTLTMEGLMGDDGEFYVAYPQISIKFDFSNPQGNLSRDVKALMGASFQTLRKAKTSLHPKAVNVLTLKEFEILVAKLDRTGNKAAQQFRDDMVGLSMLQLFSDAFGQKFDADDRQAWLKQRQEGKVVRRTLTDAIKAYIMRHVDELSDNAVRFMYSNASDAVNRAVFARPAKKLCQDLKVDSKDLLRDNLSNEEIRHLEHVEALAMRLIDTEDMEPYAAVQEAQKRLIIPVTDRAA